MTALQDSNRFGTLDTQKLNDFFKKKQLFSVPEDYKEFLLEHNGGQPVPATNRIPETDVQWIYGIHDGEYWASLEGHIEMFNERIPAYTLPIANDSGGNLFLLSLRSESYGEVWFWDHENEAEDKADDYFENITKSANSFSEFFNELYAFVDPAETEPERILRMNDFEALSDLLNSGYDIESKDEYHRTLIEKASIQNRIEIVKMLMDKKAKKNNAYQLALQNMNASPTHGYEPLVKLLQEYIDKPKWKFW